MIVAYNKGAHGTDTDEGGKKYRCYELEEKGMKAIFKDHYVRGINMIADGCPKTQCRRVEATTVNALAHCK